MSKALVPTNGPAALALAHELGARPDAVGLTIIDGDLPFEEWENIGRALGFVGNAWQWWFGDWWNWGEAVYGERAAAAVDDVSSRYDIAVRITGHKTGTLQNVRSVCEKVAKKRRRPELSFEHHKAVASLEPPEQDEWLGKAVEKRWTRDQLRVAVKGGDPDAMPVEREERVSAGERIESAARALLTSAQPTGRGTHEVPDEAIVQLRAAFGEGE